VAYYVTTLMQLLPNTTIVWSSILPRLRYRSSKNTKIMENCRTKINRSLIDYVIKYGGKAIKYPEFNDRYQVEDLSNLQSRMPHP
jgi:hypothetical protein